MDVRARIEELVTLIKRYDEAYYVKDESLVQDHVYDGLARELRELEGAHPEYELPGSPASRVGGRAGGRFGKVTHHVPMLSLDNAFTYGEIGDFFSRLQQAGVGCGVVCEPKIDGLAVSLSYDGGRLVRGATRGDGTLGEDVTNNILTICSLPQTVDIARPFEVRGEVFMSRYDFASLNESRCEQGEPVFANPRNAAAGSLRQLDWHVTESRRLGIYLYHMTGPGDFDITTQCQLLEWLGMCGFPVQEGSRLCACAEEVCAYLSQWESARILHPVQTDGVVIKLDSLSGRDVLGATNRAPKWAVAFKYPPEEKFTKVTDIEISVGRTGVLTPTAVLEPVTLSGTVVCRASLHNQEELERKGVRVGDTVLVHKAGEIIPEVLAVDGRMRPADSKAFEFPALCPVCGSAAVRYDGEVALRCPNRSCPAQLKEGLIHYASRGGMDIRGLGERIADKLIESGTVRDVADLYGIDKAGWAAMDRMGEKSAENMTSAMETSKNRPLKHLIYALGIRNVGARTAADLAERFCNLSALMEASSEELARIDGVGPIVAESVRAFFGDANNMETVNKLIAAGVRTEDEKRDAPADGPLMGLVIAFTGEMGAMTRTQAQAAAANLGAKTADGVTKKTSVLVYGEGGGSKLEKARKLGIELWSESEFLEKLNKS